jgi:hypothetical protein
MWMNIVNKGDEDNELDAAAKARLTCASKVMDKKEGLQTAATHVGTHLHKGDLR